MFCTSLQQVVGAKARPPGNMLLRRMRTFAKMHEFKKQVCMTPEWIDFLTDYIEATCCCARCTFATTHDIKQVRITSSITSSKQVCIYSRTYLQAKMPKILLRQFGLQLDMSGCFGRNEMWEDPRNYFDLSVCI